MAIDNTQTLPGAVAQDDSGAQPQMVSPVAPAPQAPAPQVPTQPAQQQPAAPSVTTPPVAPSPNQRLHSFVSSVLSGITTSLAGKAPVRYSVDPATGKMGPDPNQPEDTRGAQGRRILGNALEGLGAGAKAGGQKSGLANALAGLGAGAEAATASSQAADKQAKQQANEDFDRQQQKILRMHDIARGNMLMVSTMQHIYQEELDHDPVRKLNAEWTSAAEGENIPVHYMTESEAAALWKKNPQQLLAEHIVMPLGKKVVKDQNGEPVIDAATGQPKFEGQVVAIDGLHEGQFDKVPQSFVDAVKKYAPYSGQGITGLDGLTAEHPMSVQDFTKFHTAIQEGRKAELAGWVEKTPGANAVQDPNDPKGVLQYNPLTQETRPYKGGKPLGAAKEQADIDEKEANANKKGTSEAETERHNRAEEANKASELSLKKAENNFINPSGSSGLSGDAYLQTLPQPQRDLLASIAEGRNTKAAIQNRKGELTPLGLAVMQAYPDFNIQKAAKYGDTLKEYQSTKNGTAGGSLNAGATALKHLASLKQINDAHPLDVRIHGTKANLAYNNLLDTVADELVTFYNEPKTNETIASKKSTLGSLANRDSAIVEQAKAMSAKLQSFQQSWDNASPRASFRPPMPYIDNDARKALQALAPDFVAANPQFAPSQQQPNQTQPATGKPAMPAGATHIVPGPDGKNHYTNINGTVDYGVAQ